MVHESVRSVKRLYVCRHGESQLNAAGRYSGQLDTPLTERGREQARVAGEQAGALEIDLIVASPLSRAAETARIIAEALGYDPAAIIAQPLAMERSYGALEGQPWTVPADPLAFPDIETEATLNDRARQTLERLRLLEQDTILLVSHGSFLLSLQDLLKPDADHRELPNAAIVQFL